MNGNIAARRAHINYRETAFRPSVIEKPKFFVVSGTPEPMSNAQFTTHLSNAYLQTGVADMATPKSKSGIPDWAYKLAAGLVVVVVGYLFIDMATELKELRKALPQERIALVEAISSIKDEMHQGRLELVREIGGLREDMQKGQADLIKQVGAVREETAKVNVRLDALIAQKQKAP